MTRDISWQMASFAISEQKLGYFKTCHVNNDGAAPVFKAFVCTCFIPERHPDLM